MRNAFIGELIRLAEVDERIFLIVGDLGYSVVEPFKEQFPTRFVNAGVAEQNMTGLAAGLAREGYKTFIYSIANFPTLRCLEQIRNDVCYHALDVTLVAVGGGFMYGSAGTTHHATEDIGILRSLPNLRLFAPSLPLQIPHVMGEIVSSNGPAYLRIGKALDSLSQDGYAVLEGGWLAHRDGASRAILTIGNVSGIADKYLGLERKDFDHWIGGRLKPMPEQVVRSLLAYKEIFIFENHQRSGGLYSMLAEMFYPYASRGVAPVLHSYAIPDMFPSIVGKEASLSDEMVRPMVVK